MSRYIATRAIRGANALVSEAELMLKKALAEKGPDTPVQFPNTAYYLPMMLGMTGAQVETLGQIEPILEHARLLLHPLPSGNRWTPYLGETLDSGMATLLAAEAIEAVRFVYGLQPEPLPGFQLAGGTSYAGMNGGSGNGDGHLNGPIDDIQLRMGHPAGGRAYARLRCHRRRGQVNEVAVTLVRELQKRNILTFLSGNVNGRSIIHQLMEEGVEMGYDTYTVPFGTDTISAIYALGFATRSALTFGGHERWHGPGHPAVQQEPRVCLRAGLGRGGRPEICGCRRRHQLWLPGDRRYRDPGDPADRSDHLRARGQHALRRNRWRKPTGEGQAPGAEMHRSARRQSEVADVPVPVPYGSAFEGERGT
jgi:hypothetical protein